MMLLDNKTYGTVISALQKNIKPGARFSVLCQLFSLYGYEALQKELASLQEMRLLLTQPPSQQGKSLSFLKTLCGQDSENRLKNRLMQARIAQDCATWIQHHHPRIKALSHAVGQNIFHIANPEQTSFSIQGSSDLTASGVGEVPSDRIDMNMAVTAPESTQQMLQVFNNLWQDPHATADITQEILNSLTTIAADKPANLIYFITLYHLFRTSLNNLNEETIIRSKTGFKETIVWNKLYKFQRDGVLGAIDKLEKYNGCILADSVGLGKTFEALAVIKYYELRNDRVLVLCPKKLRENWAIFTRNDKRNILNNDRFRYDILNHTDLNRSTGHSGDINLETLNWSNYDLIVIDESHNFRNSGTKAGGATRYQALMNKVIRSGVKTKVLMLSATPVNSRMTDLKNQVALITEGNDTALQEYGISSIENTLRIAQKKFNEWLKNNDEEHRTTLALLESMNFDYFKLLDLITIARSRKHIEKYYNALDIGKFPERLKPKNIYAPIDCNEEFPPLNEINKTIQRLTLAAYTPFSYVRVDKQEQYGRKYDQKLKGNNSFRQSDREQNMIHLMRVNLLKRMESSICSFRQTVKNIHDKITTLLNRIETHTLTDIEDYSIEDIDIDDPDFEEHLVGKKIKVLLQDIDLVRWRQDLEDDQKALAHVLQEAQTIDENRDAKLQKLKEVIADKIENPINACNKKVIIFTAFADTADYLYHALAPWAQTTLSLHTALITGNGQNKCTLNIAQELNTLLINFSPLSKERSKIDPETTTDIDILIATDCISEGQNLQDCDTLINYDIHWNPVRIIQRFGRIDRLGSPNKTIQLVNFWPNMELEEYINLADRVSGRMVLLDVSATGEDNVIAQNDKQIMNDLEYRRKQMQQLQELVVDLEDIDGGVSITDLTLNDFRMDLLHFLKDHKTLLENAPTGYYATLIPTADELKDIRDDIKPGALFCLRDSRAKTSDKPQNNTPYALAPYYLVYVAEDGSILFNHLQSKKSLDIFKKLCATRNELDLIALESLAAATHNGNTMTAYQTMLEAAIQSICGKTEEKGVESLFSRGGTTLTSTFSQTMDDFEVICFLIIQSAP